MKIYKIITAGSVDALASAVNRKLASGWYLYGGLVVVQMETNRVDGYSGTCLNSEFYQPMLMHKKDEKAKEE